MTRFGSEASDRRSGSGAGGCLSRVRAGDEVVPGLVTKRLIASDRSVPPVSPRGVLQVKSSKSVDMIHGHTTPAVVVIHVGRFIGPDHGGP
jgi:hypothetical protein